MRGDIVGAVRLPELLVEACSTRSILPTNVVTRLVMWAGDRATCETSSERLSLAS